MSNSIPTIAVDVMGSDLGPEELIAGIKSVLSSDKGDYQIIVVGNCNLIEHMIARHGLNQDRRVRIYNALQIIEMDEKPVQAMKSKKESSMMRSIDLVKLGIADAVLSCGNTGALMVGGTVKLRTMEGIERPALGTVIPGKTKSFVMIDVGAAPDPKSESLVDNAVLGSNYARVALGVKNPRVGLLSNGTEDCKGNSLVQSAHRMFKAQEGVINYGGLIEGFNLFDGKFDVVVCDGFTGNVVIKSLESSVRMFKEMIKEEVMRSWIYKLGIFIASGAFRNLKKRLPLDKVSGAPLLGLNGFVVKAHGSSNRKQFAGALEIAIRCLRKQLQQKIKDDIDRLHIVFEERKKLAIQKEREIARLHNSDGK